MKTWRPKIHVRPSIMLGVFIVLVLCASGCVRRGYDQGYYDQGGNYYGGSGYYYPSYDEYYRQQRPREWQAYQAERNRRLEAERRAASNAAEVRRLQKERAAWERQQQQYQQQQYQGWQHDHQGQRPPAPRQ